MGNKKVTQFATTQSLYDDDLVSISRTGYNVKATMKNLRGMDPLSANSWTRVTGLPRLRLTGTGTVSIDARDSLGNITAGVESYSVSGAVNQIEFPFFGESTIEVRATVTGTAVAEII